MAAELSYYYGYEAEQFSFYRIPKLLFTDSRFAGISTDAKLLYGILLDRMSLSMKNGWHDDQGRVYIVFTLEDVAATLGYKTEKAIKLFNELDTKKGVGLIERVRQGQGRASLIYVKNFAGENQTSENRKSRPRKNRGQDFRKSKVKNSEKQKSRLRKIGFLKLGKSEVLTSENRRLIRRIVVILTGVRKDYLPRKE